MSGSGTLTVTGGTGGVVANRELIEQLAGLFRTTGGDLTMAALEVANCARTVPISIDRALAGTGEAFATTVALQDAYRALTDIADHAARLGHLLQSAAHGYPWGTTALDAGIMDQVDGLLHGLVSVATLGHSSGGHPQDSVAGVDRSTVDELARLAAPAPLSGLVSPDDDGLGIAVATGTATVAAPRNLADVITGLADVDREGTHGGIDVRVVTDADGHRRAIVDITGTRTWRGGGHDPADLATNTAALIGKPTAYSKGVVDALRKAGVRPGEPVMLVGHSQGGMVAVNTARDMTRTGEFRVTHVVTAGSPIGLTAAHLPASVRLLALENTRDLVPRLDSRVNPDRPHLTTVSGSYGDGSVGGNHSLDRAYRPLAEAVDHDSSRSVRDFLASAGGFLHGVSVEQHRFRVERR